MKQTCKSWCCLSVATLKIKEWWPRWPRWPDECSFADDWPYGIFFWCGQRSNCLDNLIFVTDQQLPRKRSRGRVCLEPWPRTSSPPWPCRSRSPPWWRPRCTWRSVSPCSAPGTGPGRSGSAAPRRRSWGRRGRGWRGRGRGCAGAGWCGPGSRSRARGSPRTRSCGDQSQPAPAEHSAESARV